jgi:hypothetical protein
VKDGDTVVDLTGKTVKFVMRLLECADGPSPKDGSVVINADAVVVDAAAGAVRYDWADGDTDVEGLYRAEFKVTTGSRVATYPDQGYLTVVIGHALD